MITHTYTPLFISFLCGPFQRIPRGRLHMLCSCDLMNFLRQAEDYLHTGKQANQPPRSLYSKMRSLSMPGPTSDTSAGFQRSHANASVPRPGLHVQRFCGQLLLASCKFVLSSLPSLHLAIAPSTSPPQSHPASSPIPSPLGI